MKAQRVNRFVFIIPLFIIFFFVTVTCWDDVGHMLVAAIGYLGLENHEKKILHHILGSWKSDSAYNNPVAAAVWADHIKKGSYFIGDRMTSKGSREVFSEILDIFNPFHYVARPYNPENVHVDNFYQYYYRKDDTAVKFLKKTFSILSSIQGKRNVGTYFSLNIYIRLFIHILGDAHQPLHGISFFNFYYLTGDKGATELNICYNGKVNNLHRFFDSLFGSRSGYYPHYTVKDALRHAAELMKIYPPRSFADTLSRMKDPYKLINDIFDEGYEIAITEIYSRFPLAKLNPHEVYSLSASDVVALKKMLNRRIALGGYRLTFLLRTIIANLPENVVHDSKLCKVKLSKLPPIPSY